MTRVDDIAEELRNEPWSVFPPKSNCLGKSLRFRYRCRKAGIDAKIVIALVAMQNNRYRFMPRTLVGFHGWGEANGERIELARSLNEKNVWGAYDINIRPIVAMAI